MESPQLRQLRIGAVTIGLIGFDVAMNQLLQEKGIVREQALLRLYEAVARQNYIPAGKEALYREALAREYDRLVSGAPDASETLVVRIFGPGCVSCNNIQKQVIEILNELEIAADIFQVHDLDEIGRHGILQTPALMINGEVKSSGNIPTKSQIERWLRDAKVAVLEVAGKGEK